MTGGSSAASPNSPSSESARQRPPVAPDPPVSMPGGFVYLEGVRDVWTPPPILREKRLPMKRPDAGV